MAITMEDVASRAGVSRALVSLVMRESPKVSDRKRAAVLAAAEELGYRPNLIARQLASTRTRTLGVLMTELHNPMFAEALDAIDRHASDRGYHLLLASGFRSAERERVAVEFMQDHRVDGVLMIGPLLGKKAIQGLAASVPLLVIGREVPGVDAVSVDNKQGTMLAMDHLLALGHRRIAHIDGGGGAGAALRRSTYQAVMEEHGLEPMVVRGNYSELSGQTGTRKLLDLPAPPTAIFAANDLCAMGVLQEARLAGLGVPEDLSVVGFDNTALSRTAYISLTTIDQPREEIGREALRLLVERIEDHRADARHLLAAPTLMARHTSGRAKNAQTGPAKIDPR